MRFVDRPVGMSSTVRRRYAIKFFAESIRELRNRVMEWIRMVPESYVRRARITMSVSLEHAFASADIDVETDDCELNARAWYIDTVLDLHMPGQVRSCYPHAAPSIEVFSEYGLERIEHAPTLLRAVERSFELLERGMARKVTVLL